MSKQLTLKILTPDRTVLDTSADMIVIRTTRGDLGILPGHESCIASAAPESTLRAFSEGAQTHIFTVLGGFLSVREDEVVVLSTMAEQPDRMGAALEERERQRAMKEEQERKSALEIQRAEAALRRTLVRREDGVDVSLRDMGGPGANG